MHCLPVRVYYEDTDFTGLVYHANYVRYFERGRSDFLRLAGVEHQALLNGDEPSAFAVLSLNIRFHQAARIDEALLVRTRYVGFEGPRLKIEQGVYRLSKGVEMALLCAAEVEVVTIDPAGRAKRPPRALKAQISPFFTASNA